VASAIHAASKQLESTAKDYTDHLWLVALIARSQYDPRFMVEQIEGTLYGAATINDHEPGHCRRRHCLYFSESAFFKYRDLDGAMLFGPASVALYVNDYGHRIDRLSRSGLGQFFARHQALHNRYSMEKDGDCLVADFDMPRSDPEVVFARVKEKYASRHLQLGNWHHYEAIA